jgi:hypothetical protein
VAHETRGRCIFLVVAVRRDGIVLMARVSNLQPSSSTHIVENVERSIIAIQKWRHCRNKTAIGCEAA